jgi:hypothetical protein
MRNVSEIISVLEDQILESKLDDKVLQIVFKTILKFAYD